MPTPEERLRHVVLKVERAKEHAAALNAALSEFLATKPYSVVATQDPESRRLKYVVSGVKPVPERIPLLASDSIQNLMSALDHLAYQLVCKDTGDSPPNPNWIYFPIADDHARYDAKKAGKMEGAALATIAAIDELQPYKGGNDALWALYRLNNIEKHRLLLTVGAQAAGLGLGTLMSSHMKGFPAEAIAQFEAMDVYLVPADKGFPLQPGFELCIGGVDERPNPKQQFRFEVVLHEAGIVDGEAVSGAIARFVDVVTHVVNELDPRLR